MGQLDASLYSKLASDLGITGKILNFHFDCKILENFILEFPTLISLNPIANKFVKSDWFGGSFDQGEIVKVRELRTAARTGHVPLRHLFR